MSEGSNQHIIVNNWTYDEEELKGFLDMYSLDEIQILIEQNAFPKKLYAKIRPYLVERAKRII